MQVQTRRSVLKDAVEFKVRNDVDVDKAGSNARFEGAEHFR